MDWSWLRCLAVIFLALALCNQGNILFPAQAMGAPVDLCCPADVDPATETSAGVDCCEQPECQCYFCLNIVLHDFPVKLAGVNGPGLLYHDSVSTLRGGVYRTIDYPPEST
jgi:hypothetical protein